MPHIALRAIFWDSWKDTFLILVGAGCSSRWVCPKNSRSRSVVSTPSTIWANVEDQLPEPPEVRLFLRVIRHLLMVITTKMSFWLTFVATNDLLCIFHNATTSW